MTGAYGKAKREESRWQRFVARQTRERSREIRERRRRAMEDAARLCPPRGGA